jgi:hypothetical protein
MDGRRPFRFTKCPLYSQSFGNLSKKHWHEETYVLNCASVSAIAPGELRYFAMELRVPDDAVPGENFLSWSLIGGNRGNGVMKLKRVWVLP